MKWKMKSELQKKWLCRSQFYIIDTNTQHYWAEPVCTVVDIFWYLSDIPHPFIPFMSIMPMPPKAILDNATKPSIINTIHKILHNKHELLKYVQPQHCLDQVQHVEVELQDFSSDAQALQSPHWQPSGQHSQFFLVWSMRNEKIINAFIIDKIDLFTRENL